MRGMLQAISFTTVMAVAAIHSFAVTPTAPPQGLVSRPATLEALFAPAPTSTPNAIEGSPAALLIPRVCSSTCEPCSGSCPRIGGFSQTCGITCNP